MKKRVVTVAIIIIVNILIYVNQHVVVFKMDAIIPEDFQIKYVNIFKRLEESISRTEYAQDIIKPIAEYISELDVVEKKFLVVDDIKYSMTFYSTENERIRLDFGEDIITSQYNLRSKDDKTNTYKYESQYAYFQVSDYKYNLQTIDGFFENIIENQEEKAAINRICNVKEFDYNNSFVNGMESFPTYGDLVKSFGEPIEIRDVTNVYIYGNFYVLVYDNIEFVIQCSRNEGDEFFISDNDRVCRVDITSDKYSLDSSYFGGIGIGSTANEIVESFDKEILEIDYSGVNETCIETVVVRCRNDVENYKYERGIYFSGEMDTGLALGIVFLIDDNDKVVRIIMGWPTAG
jgi:hypothetical protein